MTTATKVFSFFSPISGSGTTSVTFSVAKALAKYTGVKVGVLSLNALDDSSDYIPQVTVFLDELKPLLAGKTLESEVDFLNKFVSIDKNLFVLAGNKNRRLERLFMPQEIEYLIQRATEVFDVVLIDGGCQFDNALSIQSLMQADHKWMVINQQPKTIKRYHQLHEQILMPLGQESEQYSFVMNGYIDKAHTLPIKQLLKELDINELTTLSFVEKAVMAEVESDILYNCADMKYQNEIKTIAMDVGKKAVIDWNEEVRKKGLSRLFSK